MVMAEYPLCRTDLRTSFKNLLAGDFRRRDLIKLVVNQECFL